jgi:hypothetical protein
LACSLLQEGLTIRPEVQAALLDRLGQVLQPLDRETVQLVVDHRLQPRYYKLGYYLQQQQWRKADIETYYVMLEVANCTQKRYLDVDDIAQFPCIDLRIIDRLWTSYSKMPDHPKGKWGFSVQKQIWQDCGSPMTCNDEWEKFGDRVGWRKDDQVADHYNVNLWVNNYNNLTFDLPNSFKGEFPFFGVVGWGARDVLWVYWMECIGVFFSRAETCEL